MQARRQGAQQRGAATSLTKILMHMDGTNGSTVFVDEAGNTVTRYAGAVISTAQSVFGGASGLFNGTSELDIPVDSSMQLLNKDFCIEARVRFTAKTRYGSLLNQWVNGGVSNAILVSLPSSGDSNAYFQWTTDGSTVKTISWPWNPALNTDYAIAFARVGNFLRFLVNGTSLATGSFSDTIFASTVPYSIGKLYHYTGSTYGLAAYVDEFRLTIGDGRYPGNYTPATGPFTLD